MNLLLEIVSRFSRRVGADNSDELVRQVRRGRDGVVNALGQAEGIVIIAGAGDNTTMRLTALVETPVVSVIMCQDCTPVRRSIGEYERVCPAATPRLMDGQHIVSPITQELNCAPREVLIGV
jgi:hypothetical protein